MPSNVIHTNDPVGSKRQHPPHRQTVRDAASTAGAANQTINTNRVNEADVDVSPVARPRKPRVTSLFNMASLAPITTITAGHTRKDDMPPSPGEIVSDSFAGMLQNEPAADCGDGGSGRTDEEKYRDLNTADLIVVIDMQQTLLDQLNLESREFNGRARTLQATVQALAEENEQLQQALNLKMKHANLDQLLHCTAYPWNTTNPPEQGFLN